MSSLSPCCFWKDKVKVAQKEIEKIKKKCDSDERCNCDARPDCDSLHRSFCKLHFAIKLQCTKIDRLKQFYGKRFNKLSNDNKYTANYLSYALHRFSLMLAVFW